MNEPWNYRTSVSRQSDYIPTFIIFCEDEVSEPTYFKFFETDLIKVNPVKKQKSMMDNVVSAICHCHDTGLIDGLSTDSCVCDEETHVWCVFDRDKNKDDNDIKKLRQDVLFNESINLALSKGINVGWSNDAFELWVLLHFEDIDTESEEVKHRGYYYDRLTEIFENKGDENERLALILTYPNFSYKYSLKSQRNFEQVVLESLIPNINIAIERAKLIEDSYGEDMKYSKQEPSTMVHHLIEKLLELGQKEI